MTVVVVLLALAVGALGLLVFGLLRTHAEILRALDRAGISLDDSGGRDSAAVSNQSGHSVVAGTPDDFEAAHDIVGTVPEAGPTKVAVTGVTHLTLLAFLSSGCRTCKRFWEAFATPGLELPGDDTRLVIVGQDPAHESESALAALVPDGVKAVLSSAAWEDYDVPGAPYFVLVDGADGRAVGAGSAFEWDQLRQLLDQALNDSGLNNGSGASKRRSAHRSPGERHRRVDEALLSAGIGPGHPTLYPPGSAVESERDGSDAGQVLPGSADANGQRSTGPGTDREHVDASDSSDRRGEAAQASADQ